MDLMALVPDLKTVPKARVREYFLEYRIKVIAGEIYVTEKSTQYIFYV